MRIFNGHFRCSIDRFLFISFALLILQQQQVQNYDFHHHKYHTIHPSPPPQPAAASEHVNQHLYVALKHTIHKNACFYFVIHEFLPLLLLGLYNTSPTTVAVMHPELVIILQLARLCMD
jgi:hypothetical protein